MTWNFNMDEAPRGQNITEIRKIGKNDVSVTRHEPALIIAAGNDRIVTLSQWLPKEGRWQMFTANVPPLAWMAWPDHPHTMEAGK